MRVGALWHRRWIADQTRRPLGLDILGQSHRLCFGCLVERDDGRQLKRVRTSLCVQESFRFFGEQLIVFDSKPCFSTDIDRSADSFARGGSAAGYAHFVWLAGDGARFEDDRDQDFDLLIGRQRAREGAGNKRFRFHRAVHRSPVAALQRPFARDGFHRHHFQVFRQYVGDRDRRLRTVSHGVAEILCHHNDLTVSPSFAHNLCRDGALQGESDFHTRHRPVSVLVHARYRQGRYAHRTATHDHVAGTIGRFQSRLDVFGGRDGTGEKCRRETEAPNIFTFDTQFKDRAGRNGDFLHLILCLSRLQIRRPRSRCQTPPRRARHRISGDGRRERQYRQRHDHKEGGSCRDSSHYFALRW